MAASLASGAGGGHRVSCNAQAPRRASPAPHAHLPLRSRAVVLRRIPCEATTHDPRTRFPDPASPPSRCGSRLINAHAARLTGPPNSPRARWHRKHVTFGRHHSQATRPPSPWDTRHCIGDTAALSIHRAGRSAGRHGPDAAYVSAVDVFEPPSSFVLPG